MQNSSLETDHQLVFRSLFPSWSVSDERLADISFNPFPHNRVQQIAPTISLFLFQFRPVIFIFPNFPFSLLSSYTQWHTGATQPPLREANPLLPHPLPTSPHTFTQPHLTQWLRQTTTTPLPTVPMERPTTHIPTCLALSTQAKEDVGAYPGGCLTDEPC